MKSLTFSIVLTLLSIVGICNAQANTHKCNTTFKKVTEASQNNLIGGLISYLRTFRPEENRFPSANISINFSKNQISFGYFNFRSVTTLELNKVARIAKHEPISYDSHGKETPNLSFKLASAFPHRSSDIVVVELKNGELEYYKAGNSAFLKVPKEVLTFKLREFPSEIWYDQSNRMIDKLVPLSSVKRADLALKANEFRPEFNISVKDSVVQIRVESNRESEIQLQERHLKELRFITDHLGNPYLMLTNRNNEVKYYEATTLRPSWMIPRIGEYQEIIFTRDPSVIVE